MLKKMHKYWYKQYYNYCSYYFVFEHEDVPLFIHKLSDSNQSYFKWDELSLGILFYASIISVVVFYGEGVEN